MNEYDDRLFEQARNYAHEQTVLYGADYLPTFRKKFDELVVELFQQALASAEIDTSETEENKRIKTMIHQHFGFRE